MQSCTFVPRYISKRQIGQFIVSGRYSAWSEIHGNRIAYHRNGNHRCGFKLCRTVSPERLADFGRVDLSGNIFGHRSYQPQAWRRGNKARGLCRICVCRNFVHLARDSADRLRIRDRVSHSAVK